MELQKLIDQAASIAGSDYKLAQTMGIARQQLSNWRTGQKPCPIDAIADLATIAGLDPAAVVMDTLAQRNAGTPRGERLKRAMGKAIHGVAATLTYGAIVAALAAGLSTQGPKPFFPR